MIINYSQKDNTQVIGDIKEFKTSIDPKNLDFITTLLSSNLYSNPEQSFIREIVSNAWDSHIEAGTTDTPIIIKFDKTTFPYLVTIRDFGTGLSPERFKTIFCNIGSSTKRDSNEFIGGFGIGRYSALACSNSVTIISYYKGTAYTYIMTKDGNTITTHLVSETSTTEKNGVEVSIMGIESIHKIQKFEKALDSIVFFPNVYVTGLTDTCIINTAKICRKNNFAAANVLVDKLLLGNVLYPLKESVLDDESKVILNKIVHSGIAFTFNVGELEVTPNREAIIYTTKTINIINDKIHKAGKELEDLAQKSIRHDYDDLSDYCFYNNTNFAYDPIRNTSHFLKPYISFLGYYTKATKISYKGKMYSDDVNRMLETLLYSKVPCYRGLFVNEKLYTKQIISSASNRIRCSYKYILALQNFKKFTANLREWLNYKYPKYTYTEAITKEYFFKNPNIQRIFNNYKTLISSDAQLQEIKDLIWNYYDSKVIKIDLDTDTEFLEFKQQQSKSKKKEKIPEEYIIYKHYGPEAKNRIYCNTLQQVKNYITTWKKGIILVDLQAPIYWYWIARAHNFMLIRAKSSTVKAIKEMHLKCIVDERHYITKDPLLIGAATLIDDDIKNVYNFKSLCNKFRTLIKTLPKKERDKFKYIKAIADKLIDNSDYMYMVRSFTVKKDLEITKIINETNNYFDIWTEYYSPYKNCIDSYNDLTTLLISTRAINEGKYRVNYSTLHNCHTNPMIINLCKRN